MTSTLVEEALSRLPEGTDPDSIVRVTRTTDDAHPGADLRVQLATGSFVWLRNPDAPDPVDEMTDTAKPRLGAAAFETRLRQAIASGEISDVVLSEVDAKQAHKLARKLGVELVGVPDEAPPEVDPGAVAAVKAETDKLDDMKVSELRKVAKSEGLTGYSKLDKDSLVAAIREHRGSA